MLSSSNIISYMHGLGIHIGGLKVNQNSNINRYLLGSRYDYNVIDLKKTILSLKRSCFFVSNIIYDGGVLHYYSSLFYSAVDGGLSYFHKGLRSEKHFFTVVKPKVGSFSNYKICFVEFLKVFLNTEYRVFKWWRRFRRYSSNLKKKFIFLKLFLTLLRTIHLEFIKNKKMISILCRCLIFLKYTTQIFNIPDVLVSLDEEPSLGSPVLDYYSKKRPVLGLSCTGDKLKYLTQHIPSNSSSLIISFFFFSILRFAAIKSRLKRYRYFFLTDYVGRKGLLNAGKLRRLAKRFEKNKSNGFYNKRNSKFNSNIKK